MVSTEGVEGTAPFEGQRGGRNGDDATKVGPSRGAVAAIVAPGEHAVIGSLDVSPYTLRVQVPKHEASTITIITICNM